MVAAIAAIGCLALAIGGIWLTVWDGRDFIARKLERLLVDQRQNPFDP